MQLAGGKHSTLAGLITHIIAPDTDEAAFFALQCVVHQEPFVAVVAAVHQVDGPHSVAEAKVVLHLFLGE